jgi:hypothetical protein
VFICGFIFVLLGVLGVLGGSILVLVVICVHLRLSAAEITMLNAEC